MTAPPVPAVALSCPVPEKLPLWPQALAVNVNDELPDAEALPVSEVTAGLTLPVPVMEIVQLLVVALPVRL